MTIEVSTQQAVTPNIEQTMQQAITNHQSGLLQDAERLYRAILQVQPNHPDANHNLGVLALQMKRSVASIPHFKVALETISNVAQYWLSYIDALIQAGQTEAARQALNHARQVGFNCERFEALALKLEELTESKPSPQEIETLISLFNQKRYLETEGLAHKLIERFPLHGFTWKVLGATLQAQKKDALPSMQMATKLLPYDAEAHNNLGVALNDIGRLEDAVTSYLKALEIRPDFADVYSNLGNTFNSLLKHNKAEACHLQALEISPNYADPHNNLGNTLRDLGRLDDAVASYRRALEIRPDFADSHNNLGSSLKDLGHLEDAVASYRRALEIRPDFAEAFNNLGIALRDLGLLKEAVASYRSALKISPGFAETHNNLGNCLRELGQLDDAVASYRSAMNIKPDFIEVYNNMGISLRELGQLNESVTNYRRALEIKSDFAEVHNNLGITLRDLGQLDDAEVCYRKALQIKSDYAVARSNLLFTQNYQSDHSEALLIEEARHFGKMVARQAHPYLDWRNVPDSGRCLRVGLVSGDLRIHPVGYFVEGVLAALASKATGTLEFFGYPTHSCTDELTERIKVCCRVWHSALALSDENFARQIRDDGIDILVDLSGHTAHNRLSMFAWKPAPVQLSWLGYFATTGVAAIDYLIADHWTLPKSEEVYFTEKIWRLPETRLCFTPPDVDLEVSTLPALSNGYVTFACFNNLSKMNDDVVALWAKILVSVPNSRLFLKSKQLKDAAVRQSTIERFANHKICADRLILESFESRERYLSAYQQVDIALDPFPFPGGTTSIEGLWMGVPVMTLAGERFLSRQGVGILTNAGLPGWIAADTDDYVNRVVIYATNLQSLSELRSRLRQQVLTSPVFDAPRFATHFETALRSMWKKWCDGQSKILPVSSP